MIIVNVVPRNDIKIPFLPNIFSCYTDEGCVKCDTFDDALTKSKTKGKEPIILLYEEYKFKCWGAILPQEN